MYKFQLFIFCLILSACNTDTRLKEGRWTGTLSPMNHPGMENAVAYDVSYTDKKLNISLLGPGGEAVITKNARFQRDTLFFSFNEPEEQVLLNCALARNNDNTFEGRCSDSEGKWAQFSMKPPQ